MASAGQNRPAFNLGVVEEIHPRFLKKPREIMKIYQFSWKLMRLPVMCGPKTEETPERRVQRIPHSVDPCVAARWHHFHGAQVRSYLRDAVSEPFF